MVLAGEKEVTPKKIFNLWLDMFARTLVNVPCREAKVHKINLNILEAVALTTIDG